MKKATFQQLAYLDDLRNGGTTNMFGAARYLVFEFPELSEADAKEILAEWMGSFAHRHPQGAE